MRLDTARRFALSLPDTTEEPHFDMSSFRVKGKIFATVPPSGKLLHLHVDADEAAALVAEHPAAFEEIVWGKGRADWVRVHLANADRELVCELREEGWRRKAPKKLVAEYDAVGG